MTILMLLENDYSRDFRVQKEVRSLYTAGHKIIVAAVKSDRLSAFNRQQNDDCIVYRKDIPVFVKKFSVGALRLPFYFNFWRKYVNEILQDEPVDAVHIHDLPLSQIGIELKERLGIKLVIDLHENWPALLNVSRHTKTVPGRILSSDRQWRLYEKRAALAADCVIAVVSEMKQRIVSLGVDDGKIYILENTPMADCIKQIQKEDQNATFRLVYIGGITYHRGLQYIIPGMANLRDKINAELLIIGDGSYIHHLRKTVSNLNLNNNVKFMGRLEKDEAEILLHKSDVAVIPHIRSEQSDNSSPNKLFEYMCAGLPVLASDCTSLKRVIEETKTGDIYKFNSPSDFAEKVLSFYNNRSNLHVLGENGRTAIIRKYNWDKGVAGLLEIYSKNNQC